MNCNYKGIMYKKQNEQTLNALKIIAKNSALEAAERQACDITARAYNKVFLAMIQSDLSPKTVARVQKNLIEVIEPWYAQFAFDPEHPEAGEGVADFSLQTKLKEKGVEPIEIKGEEL